MKNKSQTNASRATTPAEKRPEPKIFSLPVEIRQQILSYAFCEAVEQDIAFNASLQKKLSLLPTHAVSAPKNLRTTRIEEGYIPTGYTFCQRLLGCTGCSCCRHPVCFHERPPCVPRIYAMANRISAVHPQLKEEVKFVFKQCLDQFRSGEARIKIQEAEKEKFPSRRMR